MWCGAMCMVVLCAWGAWRVGCRDRVGLGGGAGCVWCDCAGCKVATGAAAMAMKGQSIGGYKVVEVQVMEVEDGEEIGKAEKEARRKEMFGDADEYRTRSESALPEHLRVGGGEGSVEVEASVGLEAELAAVKAELAAMRAERDAPLAELQAAGGLHPGTPAKQVVVAGGSTGGCVVQLRVKAQLEGGDGEVCVWAVCSVWGMWACCGAMLSGGGKGGVVTGCMWWCAVMVWGWQVDSEELASVIGAHLGGEAASDGVREG